MTNPNDSVQILCMHCGKPIQQNTIDLRPYEKASYKAWFHVGGAKHCTTLYAEPNASYKLKVLNDQV